VGRDGEEDSVVAKTDKASATPEATLRSFIDRFDPKTRTLMRTLRAALRKRFPTAHELGYDYGSHVVVGYGPTDRGIDAIVSLAARSDGVQLYFNQGPRLSDPKKLLQGKAKMTRYIVVTSARQLDDPDVDALIREATALARVPLPTTGKGVLSIRGAAAQR
jgi:hypothetical protein